MSDEQEVKTIDLDDPAFQETTDYDPQQDINSRVVPPELDADGNAIEYSIRLSVGENKQKEKKPYGAATKKGNKYIGIVVKAQIHSPGDSIDKSFVNVPFNGVTTTLFNGTSSATDICRVIGKPMPEKLIIQDQAAYALSLLQDDPIVKARIQWRTYCSTCEKEIGELEGEKNWPEKKDSQGNVVGHLSTTSCPGCGHELNASAQIKRYIVK